MALVTTYWEDVQPLPPDIINPVSDYSMEISASEIDGHAKVVLTAHFDTGIFNPSSSGAIRALRAWANAQIERQHWLNIRSARHEDSATFPPSWPQSREGVPTKNWPEDNNNEGNK